jgi:hypothetical protein
MPEPAKSGSGSATTPTQTSQESGTDIFAKAKFKRVRFEMKSNPTDPNDVVLAVQGFQVKCQRGVETIVPDFILSEASDHATYKKFTVRPGEGRKDAEIIRKFPYSVLGDATYEEFIKELRAGTKKTRQAVAVHGLKIPVEQTIPQEVA